MRISDWSSDVCSSDLTAKHAGVCVNLAQRRNEECSSLRALRKALDVVALQQVNVHIHANQITDLRVSAGREPSGLADRGMIGEVLSPFRVHATANRLQNGRAAGRESVCRDG